MSTQLASKPKAAAPQKPKQATPQQRPQATPTGAKNVAPVKKNVATGQAPRTAPPAETQSKAQAVKRNVEEVYKKWGATQAAELDRPRNYETVNCNWKTALDPEYVIDNVYLEARIENEMVSWAIRDNKGMAAMNGKDWVRPADGVRKGGKAANYYIQSPMMYLAMAHAHGVGKKAKITDPNKQNKAPDPSENSYVIFAVGGASDKLGPELQAEVRADQVLHGNYLKATIDHIIEECWRHPLFAVQFKDSARKSARQSLAIALKVNQNAVSDEDVDASAFIQFKNQFMDHVAVGTGRRDDKKDNGGSKQSNRAGADDEASDASTLLREENMGYTNMYLKAYPFEKQYYDAKDGASRQQQQQQQQNRQAHIPPPSQPNKNQKTANGKQPSDPRVEEVSAGPVAFTNMNALTEPKTEEEVKAAIAFVESKLVNGRPDKLYVPNQFYEYPSGKKLNANPYLPFLRHGDMFILYYTFKPYELKTGSFGMRINYDPKKGIHLVARGESVAREVKPVDSLADRVAAAMARVKTAEENQQQQQEEQQDGANDGQYYQDDPAAGEQGQFSVTYDENPQDEEQNQNDGQEEHQTEDQEEQEQQQEDGAQEQPEDQEQQVQDDGAQPQDMEQVQDEEQQQQDEPQQQEDEPQQEEVQEVVEEPQPVAPPPKAQPKQQQQQARPPQQRQAPAAQKAAPQSGQVLKMQQFKSHLASKKQ